MCMFAPKCLCVLVITGFEAYGHLYSLNELAYLAVASVLIVLVHDSFGI